MNEELQSVSSAVNGRKNNKKIKKRGEQMEEKRLKQFTFYDLYYEALPGDKKNGANREAKTEQNTVKPKQVKKMQSSPHFVLRQKNER